MEDKYVLIQDGTVVDEVFTCKQSIKEYIEDNPESGFVAYQLGQPIQIKVKRNVEVEGLE